MIEHLMSLRIPEYRKRTERVVQASLWIGTHLGLSETDLATLLYSARLREIGKLGLPDRILFMQRADRSAVDQRLYDRYPALGGQVMSELPTLHEAAHVVECLLENFDGSGPDRLASHQIPLSSRILRVASAYEMILNDSPSSITGEEILAILEHGQGSLYDPLLVRLMQNYHSITSVETGERQRTKRIRLADVMEGMVLAEDVWSRSGIKMVPRGTPVNPSILKLLHSGSLDSSLESVEIHCGRTIPRKEEES
jgi:response regulator RpfG family c-di-GMP phosphodiesterase